MALAQTVVEYPLDSGDEHQLWIPGPEAKVLAVRIKADGIAILALAGDASEKHPVNVRIVRTGEQIDGVDRFTYLGTIRRGDVDHHVFYDMPF